MLSGLIGTGYEKNGNSLDSLFRSWKIDEEDI